VQHIDSTAASRRSSRRAQAPLGWNGIDSTVLGDWAADWLTISCAMLAAEVLLWTASIVA
jgi:hypothetical protein